MIKLFQFYPCWDLPNASPFCMKLETYLRMAKIKYEIVNISDPRKAPKGKLPYIEDNGKIIADSGFIIEYLKKNYHDTDTHLTAVQKAQACFIQRTLEEHLYWVLVYARWIDLNNWEGTKETFFGHLPALLKLFLPDMICKSMKKTLHAQGIGRHSAEELYQLGINDLNALSIILGNQSFIMGDEPTSIDACCYAFLANILWVPVKSSLKDFASTQKNFVDYCARMKERYYS